ncbi:MAG: YCF48-related protein [Bacteroidales bacterium]|nr:YCF48-related protein [Bacteroidales bacterium]
MKNTFFYIFVFCCIYNYSIAQNWNSSYCPRYRHIKDLHILSPEKISIVGGHPFNDSITYMAYSETSVVEWEYFSDIFPGKLINSLLFKNNTNGICAGYNQAFYKTNDAGITWQSATWGIALNGRDINKLFAGQYGVIYAAGGIEDIDGFLLKSVDGGNTWEIISEWTEHEINTAYSPKHNNIVVAGATGFMQLTSDGGESWQDCDIPELGFPIDITSLDFIDENNGVCSGGQRGIDSVSIVLKTNNGGESWQLAYNEISTCLNDINFASPEVIYAVGDYGLILKSDDGGESWVEEIIADNPGEDLYTVEFLNSHIGAISGKWGKVFIYNDGEVLVPEISTLEATEVQDNQAVLNAMVNTGFSESEVYFVYGTDENPDNEIYVGTYSHGENQNIEYLLNNLQNDTKYYYYARLINIYGEYLGDIKSFYTGNPIPNWDFENWHTTEYQLPDGWNIIGNVEKIIDNENVIVGLKPFINEDNDYENVSATLNFNMITADDEETMFENVTGGMPIEGKPNVLYVRMNYDIEVGDSAMAIAMLKKNDVLISKNIYYIKGNTEGSFMDLSFNMNYSLDQIPDTIMLGFTNISPYDEEIGINNFVEIDSIWFDNNITIPNSGFSNWITKTAEYPDNWYCNAADFVLYNEDIQKSVYKTEDAYHNDYAICIKSYVLDLDTSMGVIKPFNKAGIFNIDHRHQELEFYYKYYPDGIDTARVSVGMYKDGESIAWGSVEITDHVNLWKKGTVNIYYHNQEAIPDSATISITSTTWENRKLSELCIDKITFDGDYIPVEEIFVNNDIFVYPNPFDKYLKINFNEFSQDQYTIKIYNSAMKLVHKNNYSKESGNQIKMDLSYLSQGVYFVKVFLDNERTIKVFKTIKI